MLDWSQCPAVERQPGKVSGAWLFKGTRVPVKALFENLEAGATVDEFLEWFPGVQREEVQSVLEHAARTLAMEEMAFDTQGAHLVVRDLDSLGIPASIQFGVDAKTFGGSGLGDQVDD